MEETKKLFTQRTITIATYFGGPLAAGYLVKKNYEAYDQSEKGKNAFMIGIGMEINKVLKELEEFKK